MDVPAVMAVQLSWPPRAPPSSSLKGFRDDICKVRCRAYNWNLIAYNSKPGYNSNLAACNSNLAAYKSNLTAYNSNLAAYNWNIAAYNSNLAANNSS